MPSHIIWLSKNYWKSVKYYLKTVLKAAVFAELGQVLIVNHI